MDATFLLLPSPLVGPATWAPVAGELGRRGHRTLVADPRDPVALSGDLGGGLVLVPHSNAGLYAPGLTDRLGALATVYVDAALPTAEPDTPLAPPALRDLLRGLADADGVLPPWSQWWPEADVALLFPDPETRREVERGQPRLPLSYFEGRIAVPTGWWARPSAYLGFGDTYADEIAQARALGWPVSVLPGRHLHQLHDPDGVAAEIVGLAATVIGVS